MVSFSPQGQAPLGARVTAPLALSKINLTLLAHLAGDREVLCTASEAGEAASTILQSHAGPHGLVQMQPGTVILGLYPHNNRADVLGTFIRGLAKAKAIIHGLASSPSAITVVISSRKKNKAVQQLFEHFYFPAFESPKEFFAAQPPPEEILQKVVATYQEKVIKVYLIVPRGDLDLWGMSIASRDILEGFAFALTDLGELGLTIPFSWPCRGWESGNFSSPSAPPGPPPPATRGPRCGASCENACLTVSRYASPRWRAFRCTAPISATVTALPTRWWKPWKKLR